MNSFDDQLVKTLKGAGQSLTTARRTVFKALRTDEPQTMHQLVAACPGVNRASVYRTVALFERLGVVQRLQIGWKYKLELGEAFRPHHHHLTCLRCDKLVEIIEDRQLEARLHGLAGQQGFSMKAHQLEIQGLCAECRHSPALKS